MESRADLVDLAARRIHALGKNGESGRRTINTSEGGSNKLCEANRWTIIDGQLDS